MGDKQYCYKYPHPAVTTDCVVFGFDGDRLNVLLIERKNEPYKGCWAFPGGFLNMDETAEEGAVRELQEETGLKLTHMEQFHTYSDPHRDTRERVISIAHYAIIKMMRVKGGDDAAKAQWFDLTKMPTLAFDHHCMLKEAVTRLREQFFRQPMVDGLLPKEFTMRQLQKIYELVIGMPIESWQFSEKVIGYDILEQTNKDSEPDNKENNEKLYHFKRNEKDE